MSSRSVLLRPARLTPVFVVVGSLLMALAGGGVWYLLTGPPPETPPPPPTEEPAELRAEVYRFCGQSCHAYPPPGTFPKFAWKKEVERGYSFFSESNLSITPPPIDQVIRYYETRAPEALAPAVIERATTPLPIRFEKPMGWPGPAGGGFPVISNISLVH